MGGYGMYHYSFMQWLMFFYIYCFLGWIWECCYVSAHEKKWVNRGFLHGPFLPIYGFGAICVLLSTMYVRDNYVLTYLFGMIGATILEYVTGTVMEALFKVRYWDYSTQKFNLNGHICLFVSLGWGVFSLILVNFLNRPIETIVMAIPEYILQPIVMALTAIVSYDTAISVREALDLKELLEKISENNAEVRKIEERLETVKSNVENDVKEFQIKAEENRRSFIIRMKEENARLEAKRRESENRMVAKNLKNSLRLAAAAELYEIKREQTINNLSGEISNVSSIIEEFVSSNTKLSEMKQELEGLKNKLNEQRKRIGISNASYIHSSYILKRNPKAVSVSYQEALRQIEEWTSSLKEGEKK